MSNLSYLQELSKFKHDLTALLKIMPEEIEHKIGSLFASYEEMFERFCPFKVGEEVVLVKPIDFKEAPGWSQSQHFLVVGAIAVVKKRDYRSGLFIFGLEFLEDSWIDLDGEIHKFKPEQRHLFSISEKFLSKAETKEICV